MNNRKERFSAYPNPISNNNINNSEGSYFNEVIDPYLMHSPNHNINHNININNPNNYLNDN